MCIVVFVYRRVLLRESVWSISTKRESEKRERENYSTELSATNFTVRQNITILHLFPFRFTLLLTLVFMLSTNFGISAIVRKRREKWIKTKRSKRIDISETFKCALVGFIHIVSRYTEHTTTVRLRRTGGGEGEWMRDNVDCCRSHSALRYTLDCIRHWFGGLCFVRYMCTSRCVHRNCCSHCALVRIPNGTCFEPADCQTKIV